MSRCAVASSTKIETPEGPITVKTVAKTPTSVMTRTDHGEVRFAMSSDPQVQEKQPVLAIALSNGRSLRVGGEQVLLKQGMVEVRAADLATGDKLESVFAFPAGYAYRTDDGEERIADGTLSVEGVSAAGEADVYSLRVERTGRFVFSAGVLGAAA